MAEKCLNKQNLEIERKGSLQSSVSFNSQRSTRSHFSCNGLILPVNRECFYVTGTLSFISLVSGFIFSKQELGKETDAGAKNRFLIIFANNNRLTNENQETESLIDKPMIRNSLICKLINVQASMKENNEKKILDEDEISKLIKAFPKDIAALDKRSVLAKVNSQGSGT